MHIAPYQRSSLKCGNVFQPSTRWFFDFCCVGVATQNKKGRFSRSAPCCLMFESSKTSEAGAFSTCDVLDAIAAVHKENNERRDKKTRPRTGGNDR